MRATEVLRRPAVAMAAGTTLSRATGLVRTVALASAVGVTALGDAYNTANTAPNMIFQLAAGGLLSSAVVPLLAGAPDERRRSEIASVLLGVVVTAGVVVSLLLAVAAPAVMRVLTLGARGRAGYPEFLAVGTSWLRMFAPQVGLYGVSVLAVGVLQARGRLAIASLAPVVTNIITTAAALVFIAKAGSRATSPGTVEGGQVALLGWGTTLGVAAMAGLHLWGARRAETGLRLRFAFRDPAVGELRRLGTWILVYVVVNQIGYAVVVALANSVDGGVTAYQWAFTLMQLPYAVIAVSVHSAAFPRMARAAVAGTDMAEQVVRPARVCVVLLVPAAVGLALLALPVATAVVGRAGAALVASALAGFAASLVPFALFQLFARAFYARRDARTPAIVNIGVNTVNVAVNLAVVASTDSGLLRVAGFAAGHAASYVVGCLLLSRALHRDSALGALSMFTGLARVLAASSIMAVVVAGAVVLFPDSGSRPTAAAGAFVVASLGAAVYALVAWKVALQVVRP